MRTSQETRPGLSHGIDLRGKRRGGAPRGERVPLDALPHPLMRPVEGAPVGAPPPFLGGFLEWLGKTRAFTRHENGFACSPLPAARGEVERAKRTRVRGPLRDSEFRRLSPAERPPHTTLSPLAGRGSTQMRREKNFVYASPRQHGAANSVERKSQAERTHHAGTANKPRKRRHYKTHFTAEEETASCACPRGHCLRHKRCFGNLGPRLERVWPLMPRRFS
jgi:hypothetical protein